MMYRVELGKRAEYDMRNIHDYIAVDLLAPEYAKGQLNRLHEKIMNLQDLLARFKIYDKEPWKTRGLRLMPVDNFLVLYFLKEDENLVFVIRVVYGGRNIDEQLRNAIYP